MPCDIVQPTFPSFVSLPRVACKRRKNKHVDEDDPASAESRGRHGVDGSNGQPRCPAGKEFKKKEALAILKALKEAFQEKSFQEDLRRVEARHPKRGWKGNEQQQMFMDCLYERLVRVYDVVFPKKPFNLPPGWEGYRQMQSRMYHLTDDTDVIKAQVDINVVLGLPKGAVLRPPAEEPVCMPVEKTHLVKRDPHAEFSRPLLMDATGDLAHEFWEEDADGNLVRVIPPPEE
eukprot:TRINITY_DN1425_c0_g1_i3.p1 TRINITY_DN1425_c0_g1~~TRINITY_DN1425_c0_g1_i3.p1  ORF type:complete len:232 (-),score=44.94 TRINITY_DN1425_c0_g1_i3:120-815(-)